MPIIRLPTSSGSSGHAPTGAVPGPRLQTVRPHRDPTRAMEGPAFAAAARPHTHIRLLRDGFAGLAKGEVCAVVALEHSPGGAMLTLQGGKRLNCTAEGTLWEWLPAATAGTATTSVSALPRAPPGLLRPGAGGAPPGFEHVRARNGKRAVAAAVPKRVEESQMAAATPPQVAYISCPAVPTLQTPAALADARHSPEEVVADRLLMDMFLNNALHGGQQVTQREDLRQRVERCMQRLPASKVARGAAVHVFGSSASGFGQADSDMDLCLDTGRSLGAGEPEKSRKRNLAFDVKYSLQRAGFKDTIAIAHRSVRIPIVTFTDAVTGVHCDISFDNLLATHNTRLFYTYASMDPRIRPLAFLVKHWASKRGVVGANNGWLSSYAIANLVLFFAQRCGILPSLQDERMLQSRGTARREFAGYDVTFMEDVSGWETRKPEKSLSALLRDFFAFYTQDFDMSKGVVSVRTGRVLSRAEAWGGTELQHHLFSIQDPFELDRDLGRMNGNKHVDRFLEEMERACNLLADVAGETPSNYKATLDELFAPYEKPALLPPKGGRSQKKPRAK